MTEGQIQSNLDTIENLRGHIDEYQQWAVSVKETHQIQQDKIVSAKVELKWALSQASEPVVEAWRSTKSLENEIEVLKSAATTREQEVVSLKKESAKSAERAEQLQQELETQIQDQNDQIDGLQDRAVGLISVQENLKSEVESLKAELDKAKTDNSLLKPFTCNGLSARKVLMLQLIGAGFSKLALPATTENNTETQIFKETKSIVSLNSHSLDLGLETTEALQFRDNLNQHFAGQSIEDSLTINICTICKVPKIATKPNASQSVNAINEFSPRYSQTECCSSSICNKCLPNALLDKVQNNWWHNLDTLQWLYCPAPNCAAFSDVRHVGELITMVATMGEIGQQITAAYERASVLRAGLQALEPRPTATALSTASRLQKRLYERGHLKEFFDQSGETGLFDPDTGRTRAFEAGKIMYCDLDDENDKVPLFTKFFLRSTEPKECCICTESYHEINFASEEEWIETCQDFRGKWMWQVMLFPTKFILSCDHPMETCKICFEMNLSSELECHGRNGCDRLTCCQCNRKLTDNEVQVLATPETAEKFDRYQLLNLLATEENFRWCLREGCQNGQLYEEDLATQQIVCDSCQFQMCFQHQMPWHEGQNCSQFDNQREHGDPDHGETQNWIAANTKRCPGENCNVNTEKDGGCFHMTCRSCSHEFCWECLAPWGSIVTRDGNYHQTAHGENCFFRTTDVQPTQIMGNDLQAAMARRNNR
ncbi:hypothetical protein BT63DRAFT_94218 [Microthyrium microscopicum]|uniref:RBR-type E3 ubiquitin transferase n=1 Tax=Microthyrium microscopicum TaxID=703497 RepID=A0A6A6TX39_9PEZI|nr:hypothetical protein BT63DRAFT_94218 [Microthyrium microscopicum]